MMQRVVEAGPAFQPDAVGLPWWRRMWMQGAGYFVPNLAFLGIPAFYAWGHLPPWAYAVLLVNLVVVGIVFLLVTLVVERSEAFRWAWLGLLIGLIALLAVVAGQTAQFAYFAPYMTAAAALLVPWNSSRIVIVGITIVGIAITLQERTFMPAILAVMGLVIGYGVASGLRREKAERELREAEERTAVMAVAAERERIGRDLHDILGHSLTTIAVKSDLAKRLVGRDDSAAAREIDEIASIARQALSDVRATASGMREVRLSSEVAAARSVLKAAGVRVESPSALPAVDDEDSELMGYVVRESVTNVLRHSGASTCRISVTEDVVEITDDGAGIAPGASRSGLRGLERRLDAAGWTLTVASSDGVTVRAERRAS